MKKYLQMKTLRLLLNLISFLLLSLVGQAQKITYSDIDRNDFRQMNFEIIGRVGGNILIFKNIKSRNDIAVYDNEMKLIENVEMNFIPEKLINVDFVPFNDFFYVVYQYQKRNTIFCEGVKMDGNGKRLSDPVELDTTHVFGTRDNKIYSTIFSEDKQKIMVFKILHREEKQYVFTTMLFDHELKRVTKHEWMLPVVDRDVMFTDFAVDNNGDFVFARCEKNGRDYVQRVDLIVKPEQTDTFAICDMNIKDRLLDEVKIKVDNVNKRYVLNSFYYKQKRGSIEGLYSAVWDRDSGKQVLDKYQPFDEELRNEAKGENGNTKSAFNDFFIRQIVAKRDGGYAVVTESFYSTSRGGGPFNRWDNFYGYPGGGYGGYDYYSYSPYGGYGYNPYRFGNNQYTRFFSENVVIFSYDREGNLLWSNVVRKSQYDDDSDNFLSYATFLGNGELHFLYNQAERKTMLLNDQSIDKDGQVKRNPTLRNLDKGYEFMPRYGKQVGVKQMVLPCVYRNYVCFAKIDF